MILFSFNKSLRFLNQNITQELKRFVNVVNFQIHVSTIKVVKRIIGVNVLLRSHVVLDICLSANSSNINYVNFVNVHVV